MKLLKNTNNKASQYRQQAGWTRFTRLFWQALGEI
jgi:hypothetical protein